MNMDNYYDTMTRIFNAFEQQGFSLSKEPPAESEPKFPTQLRDLSSYQLSDLMAKFTSWAEYTSEQLSEAKCKKREIDSRLGLYKSSFLIKFTGTKSDAEKYLKVDQEFLRLDQERVRLENYCELLSTKLENFIRAIKTLSREITLRGIDLEFGNFD